MDSITTGARPVSRESAPAKYHMAARQTAGSGCRIAWRMSSFESRLIGSSGSSDHSAAASSFGASNSSVPLQPEPVADHADKDRPVAIRQLAAFQQTVERQAQEFDTVTVPVQQAEEFIDPPVLLLVNERQLRCLAESVQRTAAELKPQPMAEFLWHDVQRPANSLRKRQPPRTPLNAGRDARPAVYQDIVMHVRGPDSLDRKMRSNPAENLVPRFVAPLDIVDVMDRVIHIRIVETHQFGRQIEEYQHGRQPLFLTDHRFPPPEFVRLHVVDEVLHGFRQVKRADRSLNSKKSCTGTSGPKFQLMRVGFRDSGEPCAPNPVRPVGPSRIRSIIVTSRLPSQHSIARCWRSLQSVRQRLDAVLVEVRGKSLKLREWLSFAVGAAGGNRPSSAPDWPAEPLRSSTC